MHLTNLQNQMTFRLEERDLSSVHDIMDRRITQRYVLTWCCLVTYSILLIHYLIVCLIWGDSQVLENWKSAICHPCMTLWANELYKDTFWRHIVWWHIIIVFLICLISGDSLALEDWKSMICHQCMTLWAKELHKDMFWRDVVWWYIVLFVCLIWGDSLA